MQTSTRRRYLPHSVIAEAWIALGDGCPFPDLIVDPGEPSCFGCGWRPPVPGVADLDDRRRDRAWNLVGGYLERAHLVNHSEDPEGDTDALNLVLLCRGCHVAMARHKFTRDDYDDAVSWVVARQGTANPYLQILTDTADFIGRLTDAGLNHREQANVFRDAADSLTARLP